MGTCSICRGVSGTGEDHLDCREMRRIGSEDGGPGEGLPEKLDAASNPDCLAGELRAILDHMAGEGDAARAAGGSG